MLNEIKEYGIKYVNRCNTCCARCISYGTNECSECCDVYNIDCDNCILSSRIREEYTKSIINI